MCIESGPPNHVSLKFYKEDVSLIIFPNFLSNQAIYSIKLHIEI